MAAEHVEPACEAHEIPLKAFGNWRARFKAEPQLPERKLLYRRGGFGHGLSHSLSHSLIAGMAAFLASDEASYITGADFRVDGGQGPMSSAETFT